MAKTANDKIVDELHAMNKEIRQMENSIAMRRLQKPVPDGIRPCYISKKAFKNGPRKAVFHGWIELKSPNMTQTLAIVEYEDGSIEQVKPTSIIFADSKWLFANYYWPEEVEDVETEEDEIDSGDAFGYDGA